MYKTHSPLPSYYKKFLGMNTRTSKWWSLLPTPYTCKSISLRFYRTLAYILRHNNFLNSIFWRLRTFILCYFAEMEWNKIHLKRRVTWPQHTRCVNLFQFLFWIILLRELSEMKFNGDCVAISTKCFSNSHIQGRSEKLKIIDEKEHPFSFW